MPRKAEDYFNDDQEEEEEHETITETVVNIENDFNTRRKRPRMRESD